MNVAMIGLGKMGEALAYRAVQAGHTVFGFDLNPDSCAAAHKNGVRIVNSINDFAGESIHIYWLMVPQGPLVDQVIVELRSVLKGNDIIIDGGNSKFTDSM